MLIACTDYKSVLSDFFDKKSAHQNEYWLFQSIEEKLKQDFYQNKSIQAALKKELQALHKNKKTPFEIADTLIRLHHSLRNNITKT